MPKLPLFLLLFSIFQLNCVNKAATDVSPPTPLEEPAGQSAGATVLPETATERIMVGAERKDIYGPLLAGKRVGLVVNQTSRVQGSDGTASHLVDYLKDAGIDLKKIFALEHGFRGTADAGAAIKDGVDEKSGLPIVTLYGKKKEPGAADLADVDVIIFDIQDVGARFYTYISSLHYVMQGAAKNDTEVMILDRPNPNGNYVDGPILDPAYRSFIGMHPIPVVHGMTIGEYGQMINGQKWLDKGIQAKLTVIPCKNYERSMHYDLPVPPSPNLPNQRSILLYPSLCFFEGTVVSVGRGTLTQFQVYGHPELTIGSYQFTPVPGPGSAHPKLENKLCYGFNLTRLQPEDIHRKAGLDLSYLIRSYQVLKSDNFFDRPDFFDKLAGSDQLRKQIMSGLSEEEIKASWSAGLEAFLQMREAYLLY